MKKQLPDELKALRYGSFERATRDPEWDLESSGTPWGGIAFCIACAVLFFMTVAHFWGWI